MKKLLITLSLFLLVFSTNIQAQQIGLNNFHNTLIDTNFKYGVTTVGNWALGGDFRGLTNPIMYFYNGSTYACGYESNTYNNQVWIVKQTGYQIQFFKVGVGTDGSEPLNHPTPLLLIDESTGYIYVIQNAFHVREFRVWKSDNPEDISSFTYLGDFDTDGSYLQTLDYADVNDMWFVTRSGDSSPADGYDQSIINVDLDNPTAYTKLLITDTDYSFTNVRHYPSCAYFKGTSDYRTVFINHRWDGTPITGYKVSIYLKKLDDNLIYEFDLSDSKDVSIDGVLTPAELEADYVYAGSDSDKTTPYGIQDALQLNNDLYIIINRNGTSYLEKLQVGVSLTPTNTIQLPYSLVSQEQGVAKIYDNGSNIVLALENNDGKAEIWTTDYSLSSLTFKKELSQLPDGSYYGLPENLQDVDNSFLIIGRAIIGQAGKVPYYISKTVFD